MHKFPSDDEIRKLFKDMRPPNAGMPPMPSPDELSVDFYPLLELEVARRLAKELAMYDEQKILDEYLRERIKRITSKVLEKPRPMA